MRTLFFILPFMLLACRNHVPNPVATDGQEVRIGKSDWTVRFPNQNGVSDSALKCSQTDTRGTCSLTIKQPNGLIAEYSIFWVYSTEVIGSSTFLESLKKIANTMKDEGYAIKVDSPVHLTTGKGFEFFFTQTQTQAHLWQRIVVATPYVFELNCRTNDSSVINEAKTAFFNSLSFHPKH